MSLYDIDSLNGKLTDLEFFHKSNLNNSKLQPDFHRQTHHDFGQNMRSAIEWTFQKGIQKLIVIGADSPHINPRCLNKALTLLSEYPALVGPSSVAGIYLIGLTKQVNLNGFEDIFANLELLNFAKFMRKQTLPFFLLEELIDIDCEEDLIGLISWIKTVEILNKLSANNNIISLPLKTTELFGKLNLSIETDHVNTRKKFIVNKKILTNQQK